MKFKKLLPILLSLQAHACIENPELVREREILPNETELNEDTIGVEGLNQTCPTLQRGQYEINNITAMIFRDVQSSSSYQQRGEICLEDSQPNLDYLSNGEITFFKESNIHKFIITPSEDHNAYEVCDGDISIYPHTTSIFPNTEIETVQTSLNQGYTRYTHLQSNGIGVLESYPNNTCGVIHNPNINTCFANDVLVEQKSDSNGTSWCLRVGSLLD